MDGTPTMRMNEFVLSSIARGTLDTASSSSVRSDLPAPTELKFVVNKEVEKYIKEAEEHYDTLLGAHGMEVSCTL